MSGDSYMSGAQAPVPNPPEFTVSMFRVDGAWVIDVSVDAFRGRVESIAQRQGGQITVRDEVSS